MAASTGVDASAIGEGLRPADEIVRQAIRNTSLEGLAAQWEALSSGARLTLRASRDDVARSADFTARELRRLPDFERRFRQVWRDFLRDLSHERLVQLRRSIWELDQPLTADQEGSDA